MTDPRAQRAVQAELDRLVEQGHETGLQVAAYHHGQLIVEAVAGLADVPSGRPVTPQTMFNAFSGSKGVTATLIHQLVDEGTLGYDDAVARYWPEFGTHGKDAITVRHVLTHTAGVPQAPRGIRPEDLLDWPKLAAAIAELTPLWPPGQQTAYHGLTYGWILGQVAERATGLSFSELVRRRLSGPLGVEADMAFGLRDEQLPRVANLVPGTLPRVVGAPNPLLFQAIPPAITPSPRVYNRLDVRRAVLPAAGGIMTARALARHYAALIGELDGVRLLSARRLAIATQVQTTQFDPVLELPIPKALGYFRGGVPPLGGPPEAFGHPGAGGSNAWGDPSRGLAVAVLKNRLVFGDAHDGPVAERIAQVLLASLP